MGFFSALWITLILALSGCGQVEPSEQSSLRSQSSSKQEETLEYSYVIEGVNSGGISCTTGLVQFASKAEFCMGVQSSSLNNECAASEREKMFEEKGCRELGFRLYESLACSFNLYPKHVNVMVLQAEHGVLPGGIPIASIKSCVGRDRFGKVIARDKSPQSLLISDSLTVNFDLEFSPAKNIRDSFSTYLGFEILGKGDNADGGIPIVRQAGSYQSVDMRSDALPEGNYVLQCRNVAFCGELAK